MWSIADEDREFELQGGRVYFICFVSTVIVGHNDGVNALRFSPGSFYMLSYVIDHTTSDGSRLCTCGGDRILRVIDPTAKMEIISKTAPEVLQLVCSPVCLL